MEITRTAYDLDKINEERRKKGLPPLTRAQAETAIQTRSDTSSDFDMNHFLISYMTGIPMPSVGGLVGAMLHNNESHVSPVIPAEESAHHESATSAPEPSHSSPEPSYSSPDPSPSFDSSASSAGSSGDGE